MFLYFFIGGLLLVIVIILALLRKFLPFLKEKISPKLQAIKKKTLWNGVIRSTNISFFQTCITCGIQLKMVINGSKYQELLDFLLMCLLTVYFLLVPFFMMYFLLKNKDKLHLEAWRDKYSNLYQDIHLHKSRYTILYYPMTLLRRTVFVAIPTFIPNAPWL